MVHSLAAAVELLERMKAIRTKVPTGGAADGGGAVGTGLIIIDWSGPNRQEA